jgi:heme exporter protein C
MIDASKFRLSWWKIVTIVLLYYTVIGGFLIPVPRLPILNETIRLNYFHTPMWFSMMFQFTFSVWAAIRYLRLTDLHYDDYAVQSAKVGFFFGIMGLCTGMVWGNFTWGTFWTNDPKLNNTSIALLIYAAYFILRNSVSDETQRGRLSAVYNIFAFAVLIPLIYILPRMAQNSLHPGSGNNPTFRLFDLAHNMKFVVYTAIIGFSMLGFWLTNILLRLRRLNHLENEIQ